MDMHRNGCSGACDHTRVCLMYVVPLRTPSNVHKKNPGRRMRGEPEPTRASIGHGGTTRGHAQRTNGESAGRASFQTFGTVALAVDGGATAARHGLYDLDPFAATEVLDKVPDVDDAISAGV